MPSEFQSKNPLPPPPPEFQDAAHGVVWKFPGNSHGFGQALLNSYVVRALKEKGNVKAVDEDNDV